MTLKQKSSACPVGNEWLPVIKGALTAAGNSQGTALVIPSGQDLSVFTTVAASTGAILPASGVSPGEEYVIANHGANALSVYPAVGGTMGTASANAAYSLAAGKTGYFLYVGSLAWTTNP
jgi:hypothetical protein